MVKDNRGSVCDIISEMLDNPDQYGIYPTTRAYDKLEALLNERDKELTTLRFWREQNLREIKHGREEIRELRGRIVEMQELESQLTAANAEIERLKEANEHWHTRVEQMKSQLTTVNAETKQIKGQSFWDEVQQANEEIESLMQELGIANSGNEVLRDLRVEKLREALNKTLWCEKCDGLMKQAIADTENK